LKGLICIEGALGLIAPSLKGLICIEGALIAAARMKGLIASLKGADCPFIEGADLH